jgi:hypothetical protein
MTLQLRYAQEVPAPEKAAPGKAGTAGAAGTPGKAAPKPKPPSYQAVGGGVLEIFGTDGLSTIRITLHADSTLDLLEFADGQRVRIALTQDPLGPYAVTFPSNVRWPGGVEPDLTDIPGHRDVFEFEYWADISGEGGAGSFDGFIIGQDL